jgi:hypothetical protein
MFVVAWCMQATPWYNGIILDFDQSAIIQSFNDLLTNDATFHQTLIRHPFSSCHPIACYPFITPTSKLWSLVQICFDVLFNPKFKLCIFAN